jgi:hypothetical protein
MGHCALWEFDGLGSFFQGSSTISVSICLTVLKAEKHSLKLGEILPVDEGSPG